MHSVLDSPFAAFPLDEGLRLFPEGELDLPPQSAESPATTSNVTLEDLQAEDSDREDEADLDDEPLDNPAVCPVSGARSDRTLIFGTV